MKRGIALILGLILATISSANLPGNNSSNGIFRLFAFMRSGDTTQQHQNQKFLTGSWENLVQEVVLNDTHPNSNRGKIRMQWATLRFDFRSDGTFTRLLKSKAGDMRFEEQGQWEVSQTGQHLLLHFPDPDGGTFTQAVRIKYLELDEMVLEQPLSMMAQGYASLDKSDLFFNRQ